MKKAVIAVMIVIMTLTAAFMVSGCTDEAMQTQIDSLMDRVEDLENKNNVFWTDKTEYGEHETMVIYFKNTPAIKISLYFETLSGAAFWTSGAYVINYCVNITSLKSAIYAETITNTSYIAWEKGSALTNQSEYDTICPQNIEIDAGASIRSEAAVAHEGQYDFVICVPGTSFELARFVNVTVHKNSV